MITWVHVETLGQPEMWIATVQEWLLSVVEIPTEGPAASHPYKWSVKGPGLARSGAEPSARMARDMAESVLPETVRDR